MATPQGAVSKLIFRPETTYGSSLIGTGGATNGFQLYFDRAAPRTAKTPLDFQEISGLSTDYTAFEEGEINVGLDVEFAMRYYGGHFLAIALAMGDIDTSGTPPAVAHALQLSDTLYSATFSLIVPKTNNSTFVENLFTGCVPNRMVLSHRAGEVMRCRMEMITAGVTYDEVVPTLPSASGRTPAESLISWYHRESNTPTTAFSITRDGQSAVEIYCRSWELTLDNRLAQNYLIQNGRTAGEPQREDFREVRLRMEIEQNAAWRDFLTAYGDSPTSTTTDFAIRMDYQNPSIVNEALLIQVNNCRTLDVPRVVDSPGRLYQTVEMRAHYQTGGAPVNEPLSISALNTLDVPYDEGPFAT